MTVTVNRPGSHHAADSADWMSVGEAATQSGLNAITIRRRILAGTIPVRALQLSPRTIRIDRRQWQAWLQSCLLNADKESA